MSLSALRQRPDFEVQAKNKARRSLEQRALFLPKSEQLLRLVVVFGIPEC